MGKPDGQGGGRTAADPRFAAMHSDPRFHRFPKQKNKIVVDERFAGMFNDPEFQTHAVVDKRGRKIEPRRRNEEIKRYYRLKDEDEWRQSGAAAAVENAADAGAGENSSAAAADRKAGKEAGAPELQAAEEGAGGDAVTAAVAAVVKGTKAAKKQKQQVPGSLAGKEERKALGTQQKQQQEGKQKEGKGNQKEGKERRGRKAAVVAATGKVDEDAAKQQDEPEGEDEDSEEAVSQEDDEQEEGGEESEGREEEQGDDEAARAQDRWARARGMIVSESDDSDDEEANEEQKEEYDSADEALTDEDYKSDDQLDPEEWGVGAHALNPEEPIPPQEETRRLALVDLDWDHVRAVDILAALKSFLPRGASVVQVTVYPSDYGLQRMAEEAAMGPKLILKPSQPANAATKASAKAENGGIAQEKPKSGKGGAGRGAEEEESGAEVDKKRLAAYEKSRLRYYYSIVECDCIATALHLYNECDGMEFERSACKFDMRFVPDDQSFEERHVRDTAMDVPPGYQPPAHFNISLQHTDPKLSWDAEDPERKRKLQGRRLKTDEELLEADFAAYLGSEDDEEEEPATAGEGPTGPEVGEGAGATGRAATGARPRGESAEALRQRYRALLLGGEARGPSTNDRTKGRVGGKSWLGSEDGEEDEGDAAEEGWDRRGGGDAGEPSTSGRGDGDRGGKKGDVDMVVTFHSGLEGLGERLKKKKEEERARAGETVWEGYLRKKREKRAQRKAQGRLRKLSDSEDSDDYISDGEENPGARGAAAKKGKGNDKTATLSHHKGHGSDGVNDDLYDDVASDDPFFKQQDGDDPFADPFFNQEDGGPTGGEADSEQEEGPGGKGPGKGALGKAKVGKAAKKKANNEAAGRAHLELLMMDDAALRDAARGVKTRVLPAGHDAADDSKCQLTKKEKRELKKEVKKRARAGSDEEDAAAGGEDSAAGFAVNLQDPRFADMFASAEFALDPTDPRFKKMEAREKVLTEAQKRRSQQPKTIDIGKSRSSGGSDNAGAAVKERDAVPSRGSDLRFMVAKLKRKAEAQQEKDRAQALGKTSKKSRL